MYELAIYGGTFAPVHNGHIHAARAFFDAVKPDKMLIIPTLIPPHKHLNFADNPANRIKMLELAFEDEQEYGKKIFISDYELSVPPPSYTVNTLRHFSAPDIHITLLVGTDMFITLDKWREPEEIFRLCTVALIRRETNDIQNKPIIDECITSYRKNYGADIKFIDATPIEISSSDIRATSDENMKKYLPKKVYDYIKEHGLYEN